ncbi:hypothetical protein SAMN05216548_11437 [Faunimonas pinastri]|uniref:Uncharacterized protein n=1 Tax=Faunimonas pinastri TaxID=1855383 RepID=A0A1H9MSZ5_9HYPH|nr:hypothetical protein SAMN05216548_11437 [Faunimonas pinastri]
MKKFLNTADLMLWRYVNSDLFACTVLFLTFVIVLASVR